MIAISPKRRRLLAPEVVQTSAMDCGPAALKCLLEGFGIPVSYGRLREACQTDVDGTSIDTLEEVAGQLGLSAEQVMIPVNHLLLPEAEALPALLVVCLPSGVTHFLVVWRRHGPFVQLMDPAVGRRWISWRRFLEEVYVHTLPVSAKDWYDWARSDDFCRPLKRRLSDLGLGRSAASLIEQAVAAPEWVPLATLDAAARLVESLVRAGGLKRGREASSVLRSLLRGAGPGAPAASQAIPEGYWSVLPTPDGERVRLRGAVLVRVRGRKAEPTSLVEGRPRLNPELTAALTEAPSRPARYLLRTLWSDGALSFGVLLAGLMIAAGSVVFEGVLFRGVMGISRDLGLVEQRLAGVGYLLLFGVALLLIELRVAGGLLRLGRLLELSLRVGFLKKIPLLNDRYFQSRPTSDMAGRSHTTHQVRKLPWLGGQLVRTAMTLLVTALAISWLDPASAPIAALAAVAMVALPLAFKPRLEELDLRIRTHTGALGRFYLDALLGLVPVRAHGADRPVRREHESLLVEWARAGLRQIRSVVALETLQAVVGFGFAFWLLLLHSGHAADAGGSLLLAYWALHLPVLGDEMALLISQYPLHRNLILRLLEPLGAPEEMPIHPRAPSAPTRRPLRGEKFGVSVDFQSVAVLAAGRTILEDINFGIEPGSHVAVVGPSGAGKSSLVGLLLGWHRPATGCVLVDDEPLDTPRLDALRKQTAWLDPAVQLWNRSLVENLRYGGRAGSRLSVGQVLGAGDLYEVLQRLPDGLQTPLGEGGGLVSGGEGQRVRFGRALGRARPRLAILDEPFRGLDHQMRRELLRRARRVWQDATLLCITHDVSQTRDFGRVLVVEGGRIVEDGPPRVLAQDPQSRYRAMLDAEHTVRTGLWSSSRWRRLELEEGRLVEHPLEKQI